MSQTDGKYTHKGKEIEAEHFNNGVHSKLDMTVMCAII